MSQGKHSTEPTKETPFQEVLITIAREVVLGKEKEDSPEELNQAITKLGEIMARLGSCGLITMPLVLPDPIIEKIASIKKMSPVDVNYVYKLSVQYWLQTVKLSREVLSERTPK